MILASFRGWSSSRAIGEALTRHLQRSSPGPKARPWNSQRIRRRPRFLRTSPPSSVRFAACARKCCGHGGNAAYLWALTIRRYRTAYPEKSGEEVVADYLEKLASPTVEGSCIYHQSTGCGLPREMRSETCNRHFCQGLKDFRARAMGTEEIRGFFVSIRDGGVIGPAAFIDEAGSRVVPEPPAGITAG